MATKPCSFEFASSDCRTAAPLVIRQWGSDVPYTLPPGHRLLISTLVVYAQEGTQHVAIYNPFGDDPNIPPANGRLAVVGEGTTVITYNQEAVGSKGLTPMVKSSDPTPGIVIVTGTGFIYEE